MMCSPWMRTLCMISRFITALVSFNIGIYAAFGWDFFQTNFMMITMAGLKTPLDILIGLAGLWSLCMMIMCIMTKECSSCRTNK